MGSPWDGCTGLESPLDFEVWGGEHAVAGHEAAGIIVRKEDGVTIVDEALGAASIDKKWTAALVCD